ncbi:MAG: alpha/beta hydrolase-fold protein [Actinoplanes sp.]
MQSPRIARLLSGSSPAALDDFWSSASTPLIEPYDDGHMLVTFLWRGESAAVRAWWGIDVPLTRQPGTDLWAGSEVFPTDLRTTYCLTHNGAEVAPPDASGVGPSHVDARNPLRLHFPADPADPTDEEGWLSVLALPDAPGEPWLAPRPGVPAGTVTETVLNSRALGGDRRIAVYRPAGLPTEGLPVLVVFDGFLARRVLNIPTVLDNLIAADRIPPMTALFVSNFAATRDDDLRPADGVLGFAAGELMPWARERLGAGLDGRANIVAGASRGGLAATWLGLRAPDVFGAVIAQSGSFWWPTPAEGEPGWLIREVPRRPVSDVRFYLDVGQRETVPGPGGAPSQLTVCRAMRDALRGHGFRVGYHEFSGGHDYINWRRTFPEAMVAVSGARTNR